MRKIICNYYKRYISMINLAFIGMQFHFFKFHNLVSLLGVAFRLHLGHLTLFEFCMVYKGHWVFNLLLVNRNTGSALHFVQY